MVEEYIATVENTYEYGGRGSPVALTVYSPTEIYIFPWSHNSFAKHDPNYVDWWDLPYAHNWGVAHIEDWLYYATRVTCDGDMGYSIRKILKTGSNDQCYKDFTTIPIHGMDAYEGDLYGVRSISEENAIMKFLTSEWDLLIDLEPLIANAASGLKVVNEGDFLVVGSDKLIYYITSEGVNTITWDVSAFNDYPTGIEWDGEYGWMLDYGYKKLFKINLPNFPEPSPPVVKKKWALGRVGVRFVRM